MTGLPPASLRAFRLKTAVTHLPDEIAIGDLAENSFHYLLDAQLGGIQLNGIYCRLQGSHCALHVALVARTNLV